MWGGEKKFGLRVPAKKMINVPSTKFLIFLKTYLAYLKILRSNGRFIGAYTKLIET